MAVRSNHNHNHSGDADLQRGKDVPSVNIPLPRFFADQVPRGARYKPTEEGRRLAGVMETTVDRVHRRLLEVGFDERFRAAYGGKE